MYVDKSESLKKFVLNFIVLAILLVVKAGTSTNLQCYCEAGLPSSDDCNVATVGLTWPLHFPFAPKKISVQC